MGSICTKDSSEPNVEAANEREAATETSTAISIAGEANLQTSTLFIQDERLPEGSTTWTLDGPLTVSQLREKATVSGQNQPVFVIKFPNQGDKIAYIDTVDYVLRYREETVSPHNLAVAILFELIDDDGTVDKRKPQPAETKLTWSTLVFSDRYLTVTPSQIRGSEKRKVQLYRKLEFEKYPGGSGIPLWEPDGNDTLLTFKNTDEFTVPVQLTGTGGNEVGGSATSENSMHVYHVKGVNANNIPMTPIGPAISDEN